jgi:hypothetical protein
MPTILALGLTPKITDPPLPFRNAQSPRTWPHTESLGFDFPLATADSALLELRWGTLVLPVRIKPGQARR